MMNLLGRGAAVAACLVAATTTIGFAQTAGEDAADVERLIATLNLRQGSVVCEVGAGHGELTIALAKVVGASGHVYSNELRETSRAEIAKRVQAAGLANVTVVEGKPAEANFARGTCDALFMRNVYHHFAEPAVMNATIFQAVKAGGRVAVMDFTPDAESPTPAGRGEGANHGVTSASVIKELGEAGFENLTSQQVRGRMFCVDGRRPGP